MVLYSTGSRRTASTAAAVEGFFALAWFGWGQAGPPGWESVVLGIGSGVSVVILAVAILTILASRDERSPVSGPDEGKRFGILVGVEFGLAGAGAVVLALTGQPKFIAAWVCLVVGVHFFPLRKVFPGIGMAGPAVAIAAVGVVAAAAGVADVTLPSSVTGLGAGVCLAGHAASLLAVVRYGPKRAPVAINAQG